MVSTKAWHQRGGDESLGTVCCGDRAAVSLAERSAAAPNTYSDSRGRTPKSPAAGSGRLDPGPVPMLLRSRDPGHSKRLAHPRGDVPLVRASGAGQTPRSRPRRRGGGGVCECDGRLSQLVRVAGFAVRTPGTGLTAMSPFPPPPSTPAAGWSFTRSHRFFSFGAVFCLGRSWLLPPHVRAGSASHPSDWLPAFVPPTPGPDSSRDSALSLAVPMVGASSHRLSRVAPVRLRLADPPVPVWLSAARSGPRRTPSSCATGGTPPAPACGRRSTAPCPSRASTATSPGTPSSSRPSGPRAPRPR